LKILSVESFRCHFLDKHSIRRLNAGSFRISEGEKILISYIYQIPISLIKSWFVKYFIASIPGRCLPTWLLPIWNRASMRFEMLAESQSRRMSGSLLTNILQNIIVIPIMVIHHSRVLKELLKIRACANNKKSGKKYKKCFICREFYTHIAKPK
jgi:hypothetical protein